MSDKRDMVRCPFDSHHVLLRSRLPAHIVKCRKQYEGNSFSVCPFNSSHYVLTPELQFHSENCPDRITMDLDMYIVGEPPHRVVDESDIVVPPPSEMWDDAPGPVLSYLDVKDDLISKLPVMRNPVGMTKSERRKFTENEVLRFQKFERGEIPGPSASKNLNDDFGGSKTRIGQKLTKEQSSIKTDDTNMGESFTIVLKNRGRGRGRCKQAPLYNS